MNDTTLNSSIVATAGAFPEKVLPVKIGAALKTASCAYKVPMAIPAMTFIACVESSIGMTRGLQVKNDWTVYPNLFLSLKKRSYFTSNSSL